MFEPLSIELLHFVYINTKLVTFVSNFDSQKHEKNTAAIKPQKNRFRNNISFV